MSPSTRLARRAGFLYLSVALLGGFAHFAVRGTVYEHGNAAQTAANVAHSDGLLRVGLAADLTQATIFVLLAMALYRLLESVDRHAARAMVVFAAMATTIICLNMTLQYAALVTGTDATYRDTLDPAGTDALVLFWFDLHRHGYLIAQIFFGLWLIPLGQLARRARHFPKGLGPALIVAGATYMAGTLIEFTLPAIGEPAITLIYLPAAVAELWMIAALLLSSTPCVDSTRAWLHGGPSRPISA